eukprot:939351_1
MNCNKHNQNASAPNNKRHQNPIPLSGASTYVQNQMNDKLNTMPSQHMSETEIKTEFNPEEFKEKENPQLTDFQHAIDIVGRILSKELPCSHCDVLSCVCAWWMLQGFIFEQNYYRCGYHIRHSKTTE